MLSVTVYHNPRCSKSRQALSLLEKHEIEPTVVEYLKTPLSINQIKALLKKLKCSARQMMRTKEALFKELKLAEASEDSLIAAMADNPILIERPIVEIAQSAVIARPPEKLEELL